MEPVVGVWSLWSGYGPCCRGVDPVGGVWTLWSGCGPCRWGVDSVVGVWTLWSGLDSMVGVWTLWLVCGLCRWGVDSVGGVCGWGVWASWLCGTADPSSLTRAGARISCTSRRISTPGPPGMFFCFPSCLSSQAASTAYF